MAECVQEEDIVYNKVRFMQKSFTIELDEHSTNHQQNKCASVVSNSLKRGHPRSALGEGSEKTKRRQIDEIASKFSKEDLMKALEIKDKQESVHELNSEADTSGLDKHNDTQINNILAMCMDLNLTKNKYKKLRLHNEKINGNKSYPSYTELLAAKKECYPDNVKITDSGAKVHIISLLEHTTKRILLHLGKDKIGTFESEKLILHGK